METDSIAFQVVENKTVQSIVAILEGFEDQSLTLIGSRSPWSDLLTVGLVGCVVWNLGGKIFTIWFVKFQSIYRPLNAMIILEQGFQLVPVMIHGIGTAASLILKKPLVNYIGYLGCRAWHLFVMGHNLSLVIGGAGMAAYRLGIYKVAHRMSDCKAIRKTILMVELVIFLVLFGTFAYTPSLTNTAAPLDFCRGHTPVVSEVINLYDGADEDGIKLGQKLTSLGLALVLGIILMELACYVVLFYWKKRDGQFSLSPMSRNLAKRKNHQNTITLTGQTVAFAIETTYTILLMILRKTVDWEYLKHGYMPIYANFMWFFITMTTIITSNEMRNFLVHGN